MLNRSELIYFDKEMNTTEIWKLTVRCFFSSCAEIIVFDSWLVSIPSHRVFVETAAEICD